MVPFVKWWGTVSGKDLGSGAIWDWLCTPGAVSDKFLGSGAKWDRFCAAALCRVLSDKLLAFSSLTMLLGTGALTFRGNSGAISRLSRASLPNKTPALSVILLGRGTISTAQAPALVLLGARLGVSSASDPADSREFGAESTMSGPAAPDSPCAVSTS